MEIFSKIGKVNQKERTRNTIRNTVIGVIAQGVLMLSSFFCRIIFVRYLNSVYLGVDKLFSDILSILAITELGFEGAITYELFQTIGEENKKETAALMQIFRRVYYFIGIAISGIGLFILPFVDSMISLDSGISEKAQILFLLYLIDVALGYFFSYKVSFLKTAQMNYITSLVETGTSLARNIVQGIVLILTANFTTYLLVKIIFDILYYFICALLANRFFPELLVREKGYHIDRIRKKRILRNLRDSFISNLSSKLVRSTDSIIITSISGLAINGVNSNYSLLCATIITFTTKLQMGIRSSVGNICASESKEKIVSSFFESFMIFFWMYSWCTICYVLLVQDAVSVLFGARYVMDFSIGLITGLNFFIYETFTIISFYRMSLGIFRKGRFLPLITGGINIGLSILFGQKWGLFGILLATFFSYLLTEFWYTPYITFKYGFQTSIVPYIKKLIVFLTQGILIFGITWGLCEIPSLYGWGRLIYRTVICIVIPNGLFAAFNMRTKEFIEVVRKIKRTIKTKRI